MTPKEAFFAYADKRIADLRQGIEMMEGGILRTGQVGTSGQREDTTPDTLASYKTQLADITSLRAKMEAEWA